MPASAIEPAHRCTVHPIPLVSDSARKYAAYRTAGTAKAKRRVRSVLDVSNGRKVRTSASAARPATTAAGSSMNWSLDQATNAVVLSLTFMTWSPRLSLSDRTR